MSTKKILLWLTSWTIVIGLELTIAITAARATAMRVIPMARIERGYDAIGGEYIEVGAVLIFSFVIMHKFICYLVFKRDKRKRKRKGRRK